MRVVYFMGHYIDLDSISAIHEVVKNDKTDFGFPYIESRVYLKLHEKPLKLWMWNYHWTSDQLEVERAKMQIQIAQLVRWWRGVDPLPELT